MYKRLGINCCIAGYVLVLMLFCVNSSPLINSSGTDSSVFIVMGRALMNGKVMYKDLFDHKGLYLYFLNFLAALISSRSLLGVFIIECIFMFVCARIVFAMFSRHADVKVSWLGMQIFMYYAFNGSVLEGGNLTEEYTLAFQLCSIYLVMLYLDSGRKYHKPLYMFLHGIAASVVLLLRPNMIMMWGAIALLVGMDLLRHKNFSGLFKNIAAGLLGMIIGAAPAIVYLVMNNAVHDAIFAMFSYNFLYTASGSGVNMRVFLARIFRTLKNKSIRFLVTSIFISTVIAFMKRKAVLYYSVMLSMCIISVSLSGRQYGHYYIQLVPFCLPLAYELAHEIAILDSFPVLMNYKAALLGIFFLTWLSGHIIGPTYIVKMLSSSVNTEQQITGHNKPYSSPDEKVLITGTHFAKYYYLFGVTPHVKYFYIPANDYNIFPDAMDAQAESLASGTNDVIIISGNGEIYPDTGRSEDIQQVFDTQYDLIYHDGEKSIFMYGKKR